MDAEPIIGVASCPLWIRQCQPTQRRGWKRKVVSRMYMNQQIVPEAYDCEIVKYMVKP